MIGTGWLHAAEIPRFKGQCSYFYRLRICFESVPTFRKRSKKSAVASSAVPQSQVDARSDSHREWPR
jgi:hypothetical protein